MTRPGRPPPLTRAATALALAATALAFAATACDGGFATTADPPPVDGPGALPAPSGPDAATPPADAARPAADAAGDPAPVGDCRDDFPQIPWTRRFESECSKCYDCPPEGLLPGVAFITCKIGAECYRFATVDNCNYDLCPPGGCVLPVHDPTAYCRKDGINYTYFMCRLAGQLLPFQTVNGTNYFHKSDVLGDVAHDVADTLELPGGCSG
jgi:hypothetical protein